MQNAIEHNIKVLLISTSLNDNMIKECFWQEKEKKATSFLGNRNINNIDKNGIEGLDRVIRSNKISPNDITDYAEIILKDRLEILMGIEGEKGIYDEVKQRYPQIISLAKQYYDMVIVDLDKNVGQALGEEILKSSDIVVTMVSQRAKDIQNALKYIKEAKVLDEQKTILLIGRYMDDTKYNAKNITRSLLRKKDLINTIPYNNLFFEASQEGKVVDLFFNLIRTKEKDFNYKFVSEIKRLYETIDEMIQVLKMKRLI